jgi:hypothetical protein
MLKMANDFDRILDECVDRINRGESLEACIADYPDFVEQLQPLLQAMLQTKAVYSFVPSDSAKRAARQHLNAALEQLERRGEARHPLFPWLLGRSRVWVAVAAALLLALIGYFGLRPVLFPGGTIPQPGPVLVTPGPQPSPEGNFVFLISDDVNAIGDFKSVDVSILKIGLLQSGDSDRWVEFEPQVREVDLTLLPGDKAQEIWRGDVPEGQYTKVFIQVSDISGVLKETGKPVDVKLPSSKLQISKPFEITSGSVTSFVYDLTVVAAGSPQSGIKYILKPQVGQSGADQKFEKTKGKGGDKRPQTIGPKPR